MKVYCEGSNCKRRNTCKLHRNNSCQVNETYEHTDYSICGSGSINSDGVGIVEYYCGDSGDFKRYEPDMSLKSNDFDYRLLWGELKEYIECLKSNTFSMYPAVILDKMVKLEKEFKINIEKE